MSHTKTSHTHFTGSQTHTSQVRTTIRGSLLQSELHARRGKRHNAYVLLGYVLLGPIRSPILHSIHCESLGAVRPCDPWQCSVQGVQNSVVYVASHTRHNGNTSLMSYRRTVYLPLTRMSKQPQWARYCIPPSPSYNGTHRLIPCMLACFLFRP